MVKQYQSLLFSMGWAVEDIVAHYEYGGYRVWEVLPAEGLVYLEKV